MRESPDLLDIRNLKISFHTDNGTFEAVRGVNLSIRPNETLALIGESGSGKSAMANAIMGLLEAPVAEVTADRMTLEGVDLLALPEKEREKISGARVAMVFQDALAYLNPVYSVGWQISETCRLHGVSPAAARDRALELMLRVGIPRARERYGDFPHQFSGGQRQRILIALALAMRPALLIADEPTTALDVTIQAQILDLLRELRAENEMSLLMITHDVGVAADIADRVAVMQKGLLVEEGAARDVLVRPQHPYTQSLLSARSGVNAPNRESHSDVVFEAKGLGLTHVVRQSLLGKPIEVLKAVDAVDLVVKRGEILGVVGESGSGKSSLARMILGITRPTAGSILWRGKDVSQLTGAELKSFRRSVQAVFQDPYSSLNPRMSIFDVLTEAWRLNPDVVPRDQWRNRAAQLLEQVSLTASDLEKYPPEFSGGQLQRIAIARAMALNPEIIVCDEAVSALDMSIQAQVVALLNRLRDESGMGYVFIAHDLTLIQNFADRVLVMKDGKIVEEGAPAQVFADPRSPYTRALIAASPVTDPDVQAERRQARLAENAESQQDRSSITA